MAEPSGALQGHFVKPRSISSRITSGPGDEVVICYLCSDPSYESDPSNEYSPLGLTHVMNSIFLDPSNEFLTQAVNIGIPKQTLGLCFHVSK